MLGTGRVAPIAEPYLKMAKSLVVHSSREKKSESVYQERIENIKKFLLMVIGYGLVINYPLFIILNLRFNIFTVPAWGITYYFIKEEFVEWFRRLVGRG